MPASLKNPIVRFHFLESTISLEKRTLLKQFLIGKFKKSRIRLEKLDYIFCSDEYLLELNIRMLQHNYLTDILTFPLQEPGQPVVGEIYISLDRVRDNAGMFTVSPKTELLRVIFHGALHLLGYDDTTEATKKEMRGLEDRWLKDWQRFHVEHS